MAAGWYEAFPPDYKGEPLRIEIGEWLNQAGQREIEGNITIDRKRYLHVNVHLNHWQESKVAAPAVTEGGATETQDTELTTSGELSLQPEIPLELLTWIRETRRMRSEEIHFLDSPLLGSWYSLRKLRQSLKRTQVGHRGFKNLSNTRHALLDGRFNVIHSDNVV